MSLRLLICIVYSMLLGSVAGCEPPEGDGDADMASYATQDTSSNCSLPRDILPYYFVRINDLSGNTAGESPGADIDAVSLSKDNFDRVFYATTVHEYAPVNKENISGLSQVTENLLGEPSAFGTPFHSQNAGPDKTCSLDEENFVSLGGMGGYVVVSFGNEAVEEGDVITVYEVGNCDGLGTADPVEVQVSVSSAADGQWVNIFSAQAGPVMPGEVKALQVHTSSGLPPCQ